MIRQALARWLAPDLETRDRDRSWDFLAQGAGVGFADAAGQVVTWKSAESALATIFCCVQAISSAIGSLPAFIYQWQGERRMLAPNHPLQRLIDRGPNEHQSWADWLEWTTASALLRGNAVSQIILDARGAVVALEPISWDRVSVVQMPRGRIAYDVTTDEVRGGTRRLLMGQVFHLRDRSDDGRVGVSRLARAAGVIGQAQALSEFTSSMWRNGVHPSGVLEAEGRVDKQQREFLRENFRQMFAGTRNAAKALLLDSGTKWKSISVSPEDAEVLMSRRFTVEELCRVYQVPPIMAGHWDHASFTNSEQASRWFATHTLGPWIRKLELEAKRSLFSEAAVVDHELGIDSTMLIRSDPEGRWKSHALAVQHGILTVDEVRAEENWPPMAQENAA